MKSLRVILSLALLVALSLSSMGCKDTPAEEAEEESKSMEEAKEKTGDKPSGTEAEEKDTPIEGTPEQIFSEMRREIDAYRNKITEADKDVPQELESKMQLLESRLDNLDNDMTVDQLQGAELEAELESRVAEVKKEWNQTKRQVDLALGTTQSETEEDQK